MEKAQHRIFAMLGALALSFATQPAHGQTATISGSSIPARLNADDIDEICSQGEGSAISFTITNDTGVTTSSDPNELWLWWQQDDEDCPGELPGSASGALVYQEELPDTSGLLQGEAFRIPAALDDSAFTLSEGDAVAYVSACQNSVETTLSLCVGVDRQSGENRDQIDDNEIWAFLNIEIDTVPPVTPSIGAVVGLDSALRLELETTSATNRYRVRYSAEEEGDCAAWTTYEQTTLSANGSQIDVRGLDNDTRYTLCVAGLDDAGNRSSFSASASGQPNDELEVSEALGDELPPGCTGSSGFLGITLVILGYLIARGRAFKGSGARLPLWLVLVLSTLPHGPASAASWGLDLRGGVMQPAIGTRAQRAFFQEIHAKSYGTKLGAPVRLDIRGRIWLKDAWLRPFADLGAGLWRAKGNALDCSGAVCVAGETPTSFFMTPLHAGVGAELELDRYIREGIHGGIPLSLSASAGLEYYPWSAYTGTEAALTTDGEKYRGGAWGTALGFQATHHLSWATGDLYGRSATGLAGIDLVGGYHLSQSLSDSDRFDFGADWWSVGLRFLFI